jgi:GNAT superfamily N-acetyltransferase
VADPFPELPDPATPELHIRFTADLDALDLRRILSHREVWQWFPFSEGKELDDSIGLWMAFAKHRLGLSALLEGQLVGMGVLLPMPYKKMAGRSAFYLAVHPEFQRRGVGTSLLRNLMHLGRDRFHLEFIHADVYQGCPLMPILERAGFICCVEQSHYIQMGDDLAARRLMQKSLSAVQEPLKGRDG